MYVYLIASCSMMFVCLCMCFKRVRFLFFIVGLLVFLILLYLWCCFFYSVVVVRYCLFLFFFVMQKTAYECRISDWSSDVCSSDLLYTWPIFDIYNPIVFISCFLSLLSCIYGFGRYAYGAFLPSMRNDLGLRYLELGTVSTLATSTYVTMTVLVSATAVHLNTRLLLDISGVLCISGILLSAHDN